MARWNVNPESVNNSLQADIEYDNDESRWQVVQDETPFIDEVKRERENQQKGFGNDGMKKFCTIPDLVAIEILTKHGMDLHDPLFMHDHMNMKKLKTIIMMEYPYLVVNNA